MANIKISELNSLSKKDYDDLVPIVDISANETKKISIEELVDNNVELIAVSNTAPSECAKDDKYFNKTTNLIYTATATDTWGETGEEAVEGIMYIVFEEQTTYAYDGETLVSVGGGAGTYVGNTPPEEPKENDLWVDTNDEEHLAQVDDEVSTTSTNAVQNQAITNYVNDLNTYSTTEQVVGTWMGKPLYRKCFTGTSSSTTTTTISAGLTNVDNIIYLNGTIFKTPIYMNAGGYLDSNNYVLAYYNKTQNNIVLSYPGTYSSGNYFITCEYTKTTD